MTYPEFWSIYLKAHSRAGTRVLHYAGSVLALGALVLAAITQDWRWLILAPIVGYAFAWTAHLGIEHNKPATFGHPFWSLVSDYRMLGLWLVGSLGRHLERQAAVERPIDQRSSR